MSQPTIQVTIVDATGVQRTFDVGHVDLDCGGGCIDIRPGKPAFCRGFDSGVLTLDDGLDLTILEVINGMASLSGDAVHVVCERVNDTTPRHLSSLQPANNFPTQPTEATTNKQQTANYII